MGYSEGHWRNVLAAPEPLRFSVPRKGARVEYLFTKKGHGNMKCCPEGARNQRYFRYQHFPEVSLIMADVQHGGQVLTLDRSSTLAAKFVPNFPKVDAIVTDLPEVALAVTGADCYPVYFRNPQNEIIGIAHCSYKSVVQGIIPNTISAMVDLGGQVERLFAFIGPGICVRCYDFGENAPVVFRGYERFIGFGSAESRLSLSGVYKVDLEGIIHSKLREAGLDNQRITLSGLCTYGACGTHEGRYNLYSARRDKTNPVQAGMAAIVLRR